MRRLAVLAPWLLLAVAPFPAYAADPIDHVHSSSRYDRSPASLAAEFRTFRATSTSIVTWTEVGADRRARVLHGVPGWRTVTPDGTDVGASWRRDLWRLRGTSTRALAPTAYPALVLVLDRRTDGRRVLLLVAHLPSGVEDGDQFNRSARVLTWQVAVGTLAARTAWSRQRWQPDVVMVVADWNVNLRRHAWRQRLHALMPVVRPSWRVGALPRSGTHAGGRLIDATLTSANGRAWLLPDDPSSDHRPYRERLR